MPTRLPNRPARRFTGSSRQSGQSLAEFTLIVPILLIILLTVADFGRFFAAALRLESIARTSAEVAAQEVLRATTVDYAAIHEHAWQSVCNEAEGVASVTYNGPDAECDGVPTRVCVHDGADPRCDTLYNASSGLPAECNSLSGPISNARGGGVETSRFVEVRVCYRFETALPMRIPFIGGELTPLSGAFWIQRTRMFTVADY